MIGNRRCLSAKIQHLGDVCNTYGEKCCNKLMGEKEPMVEGESDVRRSRLTRVIQSDDSRHPIGRLGSSVWMTLVNRPAQLVFFPFIPLSSSSFISVFLPLLLILLISVCLSFNLFSCFFSLM